MRPAARISLSLLPIKRQARDGPRRDSKDSLPFLLPIVGPGNPVERHRFDLALPSLSHSGWPDAQILLSVFRPSPKRDPASPRWGDLEKPMRDLQDAARAPCVWPMARTVVARRSRSYKGGRTITLAAFARQRSHLSLARADRSVPAPHSFTIAGPSTVLAAPQLPHSIFTLAPNRTRSAAVLMCFVDIPDA